MSGSNITRRAMIGGAVGLAAAASALDACAAGLSTAGTLPPDKGNMRAITLDTPTRPLRGQMLDDTLVFKGIPYARPPLGPLRFKPAAPLDPDHSVFNAFSFAPAPMQPHSLLRSRAQRRWAMLRAARTACI
jgi:para-nitrobenzyl esterase